MEAKQLKVETRRLQNDVAIIPANGKMLGHFEISRRYPAQTTVFGRVQYNNYVIKHPCPQ
jgi:hypothetical protein